MKRTIIYYEKEVNSMGKKLIHITKWQNVLSYDELPELYSEKSLPRYYLEESEGEKFVEVFDVNGINRRYCPTEGELLSVDDFNKLIQTLKRAGENLIKVKKELKKIKNNWHGKGCVEF